MSRNFGHPAPQRDATNVIDMSARHYVPGPLDLYEREEAARIIGAHDGDHRALTLAQTAQITREEKAFLIKASVLLAIVVAAIAGACTVWG